MLPFLTLEEYRARTAPLASLEPSADRWDAASDGLSTVLTVHALVDPALLLRGRGGGAGASAGASAGSAQPRAQTAPMGASSASSLAACHPGISGAQPGCALQRDPTQRAALSAYACMRGTPRSIVRLNLNDHITVVLQALLDEYALAMKDHDEFRERNMNRCIEFFKRLPKRIESAAQLDRLVSSMPPSPRKHAGLGDSTLQKLREFLNTGKIAKLEVRLNDDKLRAVREFVTVWGIGPVKARLLANEPNNLRSLGQLREAIIDKTRPAPINPKNKKLICDDDVVTCLQHYDDIAARIERSEIEEIVDTVAAAAERVFNRKRGAGFQLECCGSYRRGKASSGDCDIILAPWEEGQKALPLVLLVQELERSGFMIYELKRGDSGGYGSNRDCDKCNWQTGLEWVASSSRAAGAGGRGGGGGGGGGGAGGAGASRGAGAGAGPPPSSSSSSSAAAAAGGGGGGPRGAGKRARMEGDDDADGELAPYDWEAIMGTHRARVATRAAQASASLSQRAGAAGSSEGDAASGEGAVHYFTPDATHFRDKHDYGSQTFMGLCRLPEPAAAAGASSAAAAAPTRRVRRIDLKSYTREDFATALLYFTGSDFFNRSLRLYVKRHSWTLSDRGLRPCGYRGPDKHAEGPALITRTEADVFLAVGLPFRTPAERNVELRDAVAGASHNKERGAAEGEEEEEVILEDGGLEDLVEGEEL